MIRRLISVTCLAIVLMNSTMTLAANVELGGVISGVVKDQYSGLPIEYATIALKKMSDESVVTGTITDVDGKFHMNKIDNGVYIVEVSFMGYDKKAISPVEIGTDSRIVDLGVIKLSPSQRALKEVEVVGNQKSVEYKIDKKVVNVDKQFSSASMSAVEVLENVPSVKVDIDGNVSLRGSSSFTVLIDGKPSILDPSDALSQIPANTISNIEIITNPSAKYRPDGSAGIINIITKHALLQGINGQASLHGGMYDRYGGELLLNYRMPKANYFIGGNYNTFNHPGNSATERITHDDSISNYLISRGERGRIRERWSVNGGFDWDVSALDKLSIGGRYGYRKGSNKGNVNYRRYNDIDINDPAHLDTTYESFEDRYRGGYFYALSSNYQHMFNDEGHDIKLQVTTSKRTSDERTKNELLNKNHETQEGRINYESGPGERTEIRLDYTLPLSKTNKFEAGYQGRYNRDEDITGVDSLQLLTGNYARLDQYDNDTHYKEDISGLYSTYSGKAGGFGYQLGLRTEYTNRVITTSSDNNRFTIDDWDLFPTMHVSFKFPNNHQVMASYSRRIERPRGWQLEPFMTWRDAYNVRMGNPDLQSQYIDSYEMGYLKEMKSLYLSVEGYYRQTHNKIEFVQSVYSQDVLMRQPQNVGKDYALGLEGSLNMTGIKWWDLNLMGDLYQYEVSGERNGVSFANSSFDWGMRFNNTFKLPLKSQLQINFNYNSPSATSQGKNLGSYEFNGAYRIDLFKRSMSAIVQARDLFGTSKWEQRLQDADFYYHSKYTRKSPFVTFTLSYRINNYKPSKERNQSQPSDQQENGGGEEF